MRDFAYRKALVLLGLMVLTCGSAALAQPAYTITHLGTLGGASSEATAINDAGQIVGASITAERERHGFLYQNGAMQDLGTLGGTFSEATAINNRGQIAGFAALPNSLGTRAFLYSNGAMQSLGTLSGFDSRATGINEEGQVVGNAPVRLNDQTSHAFLYSNGAMQDLGTLGGSSSEAAAINDRGQVVGGSAVTGDTAYHAFVYSDGVMRSYVAPASRLFAANDINNAGDAVGYSYETINGNFTSWPRLFRGDQTIDLGGLQPGWGGGAGSINDAGQIVGISGGTPILWSGGQIWDLNELATVQTTGWHLLNARDINNLGQIVGLGVFEGEDRAYLLTPLAEVPEPSVMLLMLAGVLALGSVRIRRQRLVKPAEGKV